MAWWGVRGLVPFFYGFRPVSSGLLSWTQTAGQMPEIWPITLIGTPHSPQALPFRFPFFWLGSLTFPFARIFHILATVLLGPGRMMRLRAFRSLFAYATRNDRIAVEFRSRVSLNYCAEKEFEFTIHIHNTLSLFVAVCRRLSPSLLSPKQLSL